MRKGGEREVSIVKQWSDPGYYNHQFFSPSLPPLLPSRR